MQRRSHWLAAALAAALACVCAAPAAIAAVRNTGVLAMSPARRSVVGRPPVHLSPRTTVSNTTQNTIKVHVFTALVYQRLDGSFSFHETPVDLNIGRLILSATPTDFTLAPGTKKELDLHWNVLPRRAAAVSPGLIVQGVPQVKGEAINTILRLLGVNFFQLPGHWPVTGTISKITGEQAAPRVLLFLPRVRNTGKVPAQPRNGHCKIANSARHVLFRAPFGNGIVLPGFAREYPIYVKKIIPAGSYTIRCAMRFGTSRSARTLPFTLSGPNTLPTPNLKLKRIAGSGEIGGRAHVDVVFANIGTKASRAVLKVALARLNANARPATRIAFARFDEGTLGPHQTRSTTVEVGGKLTKGNYRATVVLSDGQTDVDQLSSDFAAKPHHGLLWQLWRWLRHHWWLWLLLLALIVAYLGWHEWRRRRMLEAELERARIGEPAAPARVPPAPVRVAPAASQPLPATPRPAAAAEHAVDGRININSAGVEELMKLPGIGRRAAERIVSHREAHGPFASLDDLHAVEGFHSERIQRIAERASL